MPNKLSIHTESFGFEKEWLVKLMKTIDRNPDIFERDDNQILLGMGNRKINALYTWAKGMEIIDGNKKSTRLTPIGRLIKEHDEYLSDYGTWIVLIHNLSVCPPHSPVLFYWFFNEFNMSYFSREELKREFNSNPMLTDFSLTTRDKALTALLAALRNTVVSEELRLLEEIDKVRFRKGYPPRDLFHPLIFAYCICDWAIRNGPKSIVQIEDVVHALGLPGKLFNLPERYAQDKLDEIDIRYAKKVVDVERFSGLNRVTIKAQNPAILLKLYYEETLNQKPLQQILGALGTQG
jgi:hypothetical protein